MNKIIFSVLSILFFLSLSEQTFASEGKNYPNFKFDIDPRSSYGDRTSAIRMWYSCATKGRWYESYGELGVVPWFLVEHQNTNPNSFSFIMNSLDCYFFDTLHIKLTTTDSKEYFFDSSTDRSAMFYPSSGKKNVHNINCEISAGDMFSCSYNE